jgi:hypothetical protein
VNILAVTCMRNEAPYCVEWIAHHRAAGFTDFLIYTHDCTDGTDRLLELLPGVTHIPFEVIDGKSAQWRAMQLADKHPLMKSTDWAMFFDCDEFLCLQAPIKTINTLIAATPDNTDAIALQWRLFGSSGHVDWDEGLTTERFKMAAPMDFTLPAGHFFKTLFRPEKFQKLGVHRPKNKKQSETNWNFGGTQTAPDGFFADDKRINLFGLPDLSQAAWLNHYSTRSVTEFMIKRVRGLPNRRTKGIDLSYWAERNFNSVQDHTVEAMLPNTKLQINQLSSVNGVQELIQSGKAAHREVFESAISQQSEVMMFLHLSLLSGSTPISPEAMKVHLSRLSKAMGSRH